MSWGAKHWNVEVQFTVKADDDEEAWKKVHDAMAYYFNGGTSDRIDSGIEDFELLEEAATEIEPEPESER